jgi:hypothetical protein
MVNRRPAEKDLGEKGKKAKRQQDWGGKGEKAKRRKG